MSTLGHSLLLQELIEDGQGETAVNLVNLTLLSNLTWSGSSSHFLRDRVCDTRNHHLAVLDEISRLEEGWDGYGAADITDDIIDRARSLLVSLVVTPTEVSPHPSGTVMVEWVSVLGRAYIEIGKTVYNFYVKPRSGAAYACVGDACQLDSDDALMKLLDTVYGATEFPKQAAEISDLKYDGYRLR